MALGLVILPALPSQCAPYTEPVGPKRGARSAYGFFGAQRLSRSLFASRRDLYDKGCGSPKPSEKGVAVCHCMEKKFLSFHQLRSARLRDISPLANRN
jgi:hypothetical protein